MNYLGQQCSCSSSILHLYMYFININSCKLHTDFRGKKNLLEKADFIFIILLSGVVIEPPLPIARIRRSLFCLYNAKWLY